MTEKLVCYSLEKTNASTRTKLHRELYGYKDISCNGRYTYERKGLVHQLKVRRIVDSVMLTTRKNISKILRVLKKYGARTYVFDVVENK